MQKQIEVNIDRSEEGFYTNSISVIYNKAKFILDFKQSIPRIDTIHGKNQESIVVKHKTVLLDAQFARIFLETLRKAIEDYERKFGKIKTTKKKIKSEKSIVSTNVSSYIG